MEGIYRWVSNIVYYLIFVTIITNLQPANSLRYFSYIPAAVRQCYPGAGTGGGGRITDGHGNRSAD